MKTQITPVLSGICFAAALILPIGAKAVSYDISADLSSGSNLGTAPFGTVTLNQNGSGVDFTVHLNTGNNFVLTGALDEMDFEFNATGIVLGDITFPTPHTPTLSAQAGPFNKGSVGNFAYGITGAPGQGNGSVDSFSSDINFKVANSTISDFTQPNNLNFLFAVDLFGSGNTGPAAAPNVPSVPDGGATALLLGASFTGISLIRRKLAKV